MKEDKYLNPETQSHLENDKKGFKFKMPNLKNKAKFKRGGYAIVITAVVLIGIIALNVLITALSNRFMLEYDMTTDKINTIDEKNVEFIKKVDREINVIVCAEEDSYSSIMPYYAEQDHKVYDQNGEYTSYYEQTISLINLYQKYNDKIKVQFIDTEDTAFAEIKSKYSNENLSYGNIIVSAQLENTERYKVIDYEDIYKLVEDTSLAQYYGPDYVTMTMEGNNIETALTSAIAYVNTTENKQVAFLTGHSSQDVSTEYRKLLEDNNYNVDLIEDEIVKDIPEKYDAIFIVAPTIDFLEEELTAISDFLDNGEKYDKGLVFVTSANAPYLKNIYGLLEEWGIEIYDGILFETNEANHLPNRPTYIGSYSEDAKDMCITSGNAPIVPAFTTSGDKTVTTLFATDSYAISAPKGTPDSWKGYDEYETGRYASIIQSQRMTYDKNDNELINNIIVFSSTDFVYSEYAENSNLSNKRMIFDAAETAVFTEDTGISFIPKTITNQSFASSVTETSANKIKWIFMIILPVGCLICGTFIYIRRRNA